MPRFRMFPLRANNVLDLYRQSDLIGLEPPYQRLSVWDTEKQQRFIDSVINQVDTPKLYFHDITSQPELFSKYRYSVIDGKQRMLALWAFISNKLTLPRDFVYFDDESCQAGGLTYDELLRDYPILRAHFDNFEVPVILVQAEKEEFIEELFARLNVQVSLSAAEARNVMGGPLPLLIRRIGLNSLFLKESIRIRNHRFQHYDLTAKFIYIAHGNGFVSTKKGNLDNFALTMKRARENRQEAASDQLLSLLEERTNEILEQMHSFFGSQNPLLYGVGRITLYFHVFRLCKNSDMLCPVSQEMLEKFNADVVAARHKSQRRSRGSAETLDEVENLLLEFDSERQSVNDGTALERQYQHFRRYMAMQYQADLPGAS